MKFFAVTLAAFLAVAGTAVTAPTEAPVDVMEIFPRTGDKDIEKRGYGCRAIGSDDVGVCNFHCINDVVKNCGGGRVIRPYKGVCGGFASATCQCVYRVNCP